MENYALELISADLLSEYVNSIPKGLTAAFDALHDAEISTESFSFYTSVSAVASSKIEGETLEIDSYVKAQNATHRIPA